MIKLIVLLRLLSFHSLAADRAADVPQFEPQAPVSIEANFSVPAININKEGATPFFQPALPENQREEVLSSEDVLFKNDPLLGRALDDPAKNSPAARKNHSGAALRASNKESAIPFADIQSAKADKNSSLNHSPAFNELMRFLPAAAQSGDQNSPQSQWDGGVPAFGLESPEAFLGHGLTARGPPVIATVHGPKDIQAAILNGSYRGKFLALAQTPLWNEKIHSMDVYSYAPEKGDPIVAVDVSHSPDLLDHMPKIEPHEKDLIGKIIKRGARQVQVILITEEGKKTPDLIVDGEIVEMKSLINFPLETLPFFINKANSQIYEYAARHGLGTGTIAVDLTREMEHPVSRVPVSEVLDLINHWSDASLGSTFKLRGPFETKEPDMVNRIIVFAPEDVQVFTRGSDGKFGLAPASAGLGYD